MLAFASVWTQEACMDGMGERLKARARDLGLSDAEVARRLGLSQARYSHYTNNVHEPDLSTLARISTVLDIQTDILLGIQRVRSGPEKALRSRIAHMTESMNMETLRLAAALLKVLVAAKVEPKSDDQVSAD